MIKYKASSNVDIWRWELYELDRYFSELHDLSLAMPENSSR